MKRRFSPLAALPLLAAALLGGGALLQRTCAPSAVSPAAAATAADAPSEAKVAPSARAKASERRVYAVTLARHVTIGGETFVETHLEGRISFLPIPGTNLCEARLVDPLLDVSGGETPRVADLRRPILLAYDAEGRLEGVRFDTRTDEASRLLLTSLVSATQYTRGKGPTWSADEVDGSGTYRADYERKGERTIERHKRGYLRMHEGLTPLVAEGDLRILVDGKDAVESATAHEVSRTSRKTALGDVAGELRVSLRLVDRAEATRAELSAARALAGAYEEPNMVPPKRERSASRREMDERRAAGHDLDELRAAFAETDGQPRDEVGQRRATLIHTAGALFRVRPEDALEAGKRLAASGVTDAEANFLAGGLAAAGTEEAAHALADALTSPEASIEARRQSAVSLAMMPVADADTAFALSKGAASDDPALRNLSTMALGAAGRTLAASGDVGEGLDPVADLLARYASATDDAERDMLLAALGNSGDPRAFEVIRGALASPRLAPTAAYALRFLATPEADTLLHTLATTSPNPEVRQATYRAAFFRDATVWLPWLESALAKEKDDQVLEAIRAAIAHMASP
ncbi:hypothetical protein KEG38_49775 [Polyangium jinanense]|uniref:HEAT repeat domain-containing protein n=1 Tax=Polyangium jinanense TaxID=2829994 RepID=UPI00233F975B|nr:HEAT repeat domain-containing protein [Polyangium jinanense]MDC3962009.1 hypothetical protein [Polyangium jinanense]